MIPVRKSKINTYLLFIILSSFCFTLFIFKSNANPVPVIWTTYGGIVPKNINNCSMTNANVQFNIDAYQPFQHIDLTFMGNYTIFNPNDTKNITIALPYEWKITELTNVEILINDITMPFDLVEYHHGESDVWDQFFGYPSFLLVCNITVPKNESIFLESSFQTRMSIVLEDAEELKISYIIGTYKAWDWSSPPSTSLITELVEFQVHGKQPDNFSDYTPGKFSRNCTITDIDGGKSYLWKWDNETIIDNRVYILYNKSDLYPTIPFGNLYLEFLLFAMISIIIIYKNKFNIIKSD